jgi:hypothetical protein
MTLSMVVTENGRPVQHNLHELKLPGGQLAHLLDSGKLFRRLFAFDSRRCHARDCGGRSAPSAPRHRGPSRSSAACASTAWLGDLLVVESTTAPQVEYLPPHLAVAGIVFVDAGDVRGNAAMRPESGAKPTLRGHR